MVPYFLLVLMPTVVWLFHKVIYNKINNRLFCESQFGSIDIFMIILLVLLAFRGIECGIDTKQYLYLYNRYDGVKFSSLVKFGNHELGFKYLNRFIGLVFGDFQALLIITAIICVCPLWYLYKKEAEYPLLSIAIFLSVAPFSMYFSGIRQAIAMSLGVGAWYAAKNKKILIFALVVFLAIQFHTSAFLLIIIYPIYHAKITKKWLWFVIPSIVVIFLFKDKIFNFLLAFLWKEYEITEATGAINILILLVMFTVYSYVMVDESSLDQETIGLRNMLLLSVVIQIFAMLHPLSMRMNYYFLIFIPVLIPKIAKNCKYKYSDIGKLSVVIMTLYFFYYFIKCGITDNDALNIFPYIPFW